jgi:hypothetical protein
MKIVSIARKLSTTDKRRRDQSCLHRQIDYRNKGHNADSSTDEDGFCSSETNHDRRAQRSEMFVSARILQELRSQTRKMSWDRVSVKILGLGINFSVIFNDTLPEEHSEDDM